LKSEFCEDEVKADYKRKSAFDGKILKILM